MQFSIEYHKAKTNSMTYELDYTALQAVIILVAMASGKNIGWLKFWQKSPTGGQQIKRETYLKNYQ